ncbi:Aminoglycoside phosphotransferase [Devosia sp. H5989]|nr:Aminoglycoside phosphotransferase [Devosia sp. H5989]
MSDKFPVDTALVERLVRTQFPQWADLAIRPVASSGWDNFTFHLGDTMKVRLPSASGYAEQTDKEFSWLPRLAPQLPLPVPVPLAVGDPAQDYPWRWAVYEWIEGETAMQRQPTDRVALARGVGAFLRALQAIDTAGGPPPGPHNFWRGGPLEIYADEARAALAALEGRIDTATAKAILDEALASTFAGKPVWVHGDIAPGNLLLDAEGNLKAVLDFGCCAVGDPACDLVLAWTLLDGESRRAFEDEVGADEAMWARARGWGIWKAMIVLAGDNEATKPEQRRVLEALLAERR